MSQIKSIRGTKDIFEPEIYKWQFIESKFRMFFDSYDFSEIRTPVFEETNLFTRGIGDTTDIVSKEMYTFSDRSGTSLTLKPEMTASVARAYIQHNFSQIQPVNKFYYISPMFRQERPQAGRLRQFHQVGAEIFGTPEPIADGELIILAEQFFKHIGIKEFDIQLNSVGCPNCRSKYIENLKGFYSNYSDTLSIESKNRLIKNPLRILDSKDIKDKEINELAPSILDFLCNECKIHFESLQNFLIINSVNFRLNKMLVRGLDYYTRTAFEITSSKLGSQDAICGGGRYDLLISNLGGSNTPAVGWACGIERLIMATEQDVNDLKNKFSCYFCFTSTEIKSKLFYLITKLRNAGLKIEIDLLNRSLKSQLREADRKKCTLAIIIGEEEFQSETAIIKEMENSIQTKINMYEIEKYLISKSKSRSN